MDMRQFDTQNKLGDGNLLQIAKGNDTDSAETQQQINATTT